MHQAGFLECKLGGCFLMFFYDFFHLPSNNEVYLVFAAYALVGIGAAAYSPAKYGILTELLPAKDLVKGNGWIEALTVLSIIFGVLLGGVLINPKVSTMLLGFDMPFITTDIKTPAESAIIVIMFLYAIAAGFNLLIPVTGAQYPKQERNPLRLIKWE